MPGNLSHKQRCRKGKSKWRPDVGNIVAIHILKLKQLLLLSIVTALHVNYRILNCKSAYAKCVLYSKNVAPAFSIRYIIVSFHFEVFTNTHTHTRRQDEINLWHMGLIYGARSYFGCQCGSGAVNKDWQSACGQSTRLTFGFACENLRIFSLFLDFVGNPLFIEIDKCVSVGDF